jgi:hypothetical protein
MVGTSGNGRPRKSWGTFRRDLIELLHDVATIAELQAKLTLSDLRASAVEARVPLAVCLAGVALLAGAVPMLLVAGAETLVQYAAWTRPPAYLLAATVALAAGLLALVLGGASLRKSTAPLERSQRELAENVQWIRRALRAHGRMDQPDYKSPR